MASLTDAKMREMQAEMDRFEKELAGQMPTASYIAPPPPPPVNLVSAGLQDPAGSTIISANTFHQVQRQLFVPPPPPAPTTRSLPLFVPHQIKRNPLPPPPPPPPPHSSAGGNFRPSAPPVGQAVGPSFPQFEPRFNPRPPIARGPTIGAPPKIISAPPKIVYSAAPVLNKKPEETKKEETPPASTTTSSPAAAAPAAKAATPPVAASQQQQQQQPQPPQQAQPGPSGLVPAADAGEEAEGSSSSKKEKKPKKDRRLLRMAGGETWEDPTLGEWDPDDFRIFVGDIGNEVSDEHLTRAFGKFPSFQKAKVVRDKRTNKSRGFGFVSFKDPQDFIRAMRELNGKYIGNRPMKLRKSNWKDRNLDVVRKKDKEKKKLGLR